MSEKGTELNGQIDAIIAAIDATKRDEKFQAWMQFLAAGHQYSFGNYMLIAMQKPDFTMVKSFKAWRKVGRHPRAGTGLKILFPFVWFHRYDAQGRKIHWQDKKTKAARREFGGMNFGVGNVFDVSDTDGQDLPTAQWYSIVEDTALFCKLEKFCKENNIGIELVEKIFGQARGASYGGNIKLISQGVKTFAHEIAHELLHQGDTRGNLERSQKEIEAEMVALLVCKSFNVDVLDTSAVYLAAWGANGENVRKSLDRIYGCYKKIVNAITEEPEEEQE